MKSKEWGIKYWAKYHTELTEHRVMEKKSWGWTRDNWGHEEEHEETLKWEGCRSM